MFQGFIHLSLWSLLSNGNVLSELLEKSILDGYIYYFTDCISYICRTLAIKLSQITYNIFRYYVQFLPF